VNRYTAKRYTNAGLTLRLSEWAARAGMSYSTLHRRLHQYKQSMAQALSDPVRPGRKRGFKPKRRQAPQRSTVGSNVLRSWGRA